MNNFKISIYFIFILCLLFSCNKDDDSSQLIEELTLTDQLDQLIDSRQSEDSPGLSVLIRKDGQVVYQNNKGMARHSDRHRIDANTGFRIGSISKPFTALAIMKMVEDDMISLEDEVLDIVPDLPQSYKGMTIFHLLTHSAGLLDFIDDNTNIQALNNVTLSQIIDLIPTSGLEKLDFQPGTSAEYSNTGYAILALIIEKLTSKSYPEYLTENIFEPLKMTNTFVISEHMHLGDLNTNYALNFGRDIKVKGFNSLIYGPSGIVSTSLDLNRFIEGLLGGQIVSLATLDQMIQPYSSIHWLSQYGLGWMTGKGHNFWHQDVDLTDTNDFWHIGGFDSYRSLLSVNPDLKLEVIILTNGGDRTQELSYDILRKVRAYYKSMT